MAEIERFKTMPRASHCVAHGDTVYVAGQIADDPSLDVGGQTRQVLARIEALLEMAGTDKSKLLAATVYLANIGHFAQMNEVWDAWVSPGNTPARACVETRLAMPDLLVEIVCTAAR